MNRQSLIESIAQRAGGTKAEAAKYLNAVLGTIADNLTQGDKEIALPDFGRFSVRHVAERQAVNPQTKEPVTVEAHDRVVFKASDNLSIYSRKHQ